MAKWVRGHRLREPIDGTFRVVSVNPVTLDDGYVRLDIAGVLTGPGLPATSAHDRLVRTQNDVRPEVKHEYPARIDRTKPSKFVVEWPARSSQFAQEQGARQYADQVARAIRLGVDPDIVPQAGAVPTRLRDMVEERYMIECGNQPLVDGTEPVNVGEAEILYLQGESATATITGIDFLPVAARLLPPGGRIAHVALDVHRADGSRYSALARFGFKHAGRVARYGHVGATVPIRIDPADQRRIVLDGPALTD
jgi:hypothetical protein